MSAPEKKCIRKKKLLAAMAIFLLCLLILSDERKKEEKPDFSGWIQAEQSFKPENSGEESVFSAKPGFHVAVGEKGLTFYYVGEETASERSD